MIDGAEVKRLREGKGLSLRDLAERVWACGGSLSAARISQLEAGGEDMKLSKAEALAAALGVTVNDILLEPMLGLERAAPAGLGGDPGQRKFSDGGGCLASGSLVVDSLVNQPEK